MRSSSNGFSSSGVVIAEKEWLAGKDYRNRSGTMKLFVFGDSYVDTGNWDKSSGSWHSPYGMTFPRKPSGRFSDGHILTDYIGHLSLSCLHSSVALLIILTIGKERGKNELEDYRKHSC